jgi:O-antigen biosynthesis protein
MTSLTPTTHQSPPTVTIVFVALNSAAFVDKAIQSIQKQTYPAEAIQTVLVDNGSQDETVAVVREKFPWVHILCQPENLGFAIANNIGMRAFDADYFALINTDVVLQPSWLSRMLEVVQADPSIAVAGCKVFYGNGVLLQHAGGMIRDNALTYHLGDGELDIGQYDRLVDVDYVIGAAFLMRGAVAKTLNYLPEVYFPLYFEEVEYCLRVRKAGHRVVYVPNAVAYHDEKHSRSRAQTPQFVRRYHTHRYLFALRNFTTDGERRKFRIAERNWRRWAIRSPHYRAALLQCKLTHWRLLLRHPWLLRA